MENVNINSLPQSSTLNYPQFNSAQSNMFNNSYDNSVLANLIQEEEEEADEDDEEVDDVVETVAPVVAPKRGRGRPPLSLEEKAKRADIKLKKGSKKPKL